MTIHSKLLLIFAGLFGAASISLAAIGEHSWQALLIESQQLNTFRKAVDYVMTGAITLAAIAAVQMALPNGKFFISGYLITLGTLLFSGTLFIMTIFKLEFSMIVFAAPIGGTLMIISWLSIAVIALFTRHQHH